MADNLKQPAGDEIEQTSAAIASEVTAAAETTEVKAGKAQIGVESSAGIVGEADYSEFMGKAFLLYSVSVLVDRALPSIDGLKPVHRRILLAMNDRRLHPKAPYAKCARIVGEAMAAYHPHGDQSIYDALVRMAQDFSMRLPIIDGHGSFGSIDGDPPAAYRYTEARMSRAAEELLADLDPEILPDFYGRNFDESRPEPHLLPARFPNILINGSSGIAVGMSTQILPHNPREAIELCSWRLKNPEASIEKMLARISGPDFPTGATVVNDDGLRQSYLTGKGKVTALAKSHIEPIQGNREKIVITEIPYAVNKGDLLQKIAKLYGEGKLPELTDFNDYSKGDHDIRIEMALRRGSNSKAVIQRLYKHTMLRKVYGVEMNCLIGGQPKTLNLQEIIDHFLDFRRYVVIKRAEKRMREIELRLKKLDAYLKVIGATDKVVEIIKKSKDRQAAKPPLQKLLKIDEEQSQWIIEMPLGSLTQLDSFKIKEEAEELKKELKELQILVKSHDKVTELMLGEFKSAATEFGSDRRSSMTESSGQADEDLAMMTVPAEDCILLVSREGRAICGQGTLQRGASLKLEAEDRLVAAYEASTDQEWLVMTDQGRALRLRLAEVELDSRRAAGQKLAEVIGLEGDEKVVALHKLPFEEDSAFLSVSRKGMVKRTSWKELSSAHSSGIACAKVQEDDEIVSYLDCPDASDIVLLAKGGKAIRFKASDARLMGRVAGGVKGIRLGEGDEVVAAYVVQDEAKEQMLFATSGGFAKRVSMKEIPTKGRGGGGVAVMKTGGKYGEPSLGILCRDDSVLWIDAGGGKLKEIEPKQVPKAGRAIVPKRWPGKEETKVVFAIPAAEKK